MKIIKPNLNFRRLIDINLKNIDGIALHHMAHTSWNINEVHNYHRNNLGWNGIGYNYFVDFKGNVYEGRGLTQGAGVLGHNNHLLSIGFQGDFNKQKMSESQLKAGVKLIKWLKKEVPTIKNIQEHKHWNSTSCAGKNFPYEEIMNLVNEIDIPKWKIQDLEELHKLKIVNDFDDWVEKIDEPAPNWLVFILMNRIRKYLGK